MIRSAIKYLRDWKNDQNRKPLVIRGARQVGKTYLVRNFAQESFQQLIEINFEEKPEIASYFEEKEPDETLMLLEAHFRLDIQIGKTLLFLDEIQAAPKVFAKLRYFYEKIPQIHIIAAGSLLEFVLEEHNFSMPVGRIEYLHIGPVSFSEFLTASGEDRLLDIIRQFGIEKQIPNGLHQRLIRLFKTYLYIGGMPEVMNSFLIKKNYQTADKLKTNILNTYQDDFSKYGHRVSPLKMLTVFKSIPQFVGQKVKYVNISRDYTAKEVAKVLHMFELARICHKVCHSTSSGIPLAATENRKKYKLLFLDVGLLLSACRLNISDLEMAKDVMLVNSGSVCEQFVGQHLLYRQELYRNPEVHYWIREKPSANAEVDYIISEGTQIIPIEVKSGKTGTLRSLHQFVVEHDTKLGIRLNMDKPSLVQAQGQLPDGRHYDYPLLTLPLYMVEEIGRMVRAKNPDKE